MKLENSLNNFHRLGERTLRYRWVLMTLLGGLTSVFELRKHELGSFFQPNLELLYEIIVMGCILPLLGGFLLTNLVHSRENSARYKERLDQYKTLIQELARHRELGELIKFLVRYPSSILPVERIELYIYDHRRARLELASTWNRENSEVPYRHNLSAELCRVCLASHDNPIHAAYGCPFVERPLNEFCLALSYNKVLIGTLHLACKPGASLTQEQMDFVKNIMPELALALAIAIASPRQLARVRLQTQHMERQQTAIDLHNVLAQEAGFLHLGLDRLASDQRIEMNATLRDELERMRLTAADIYQQVRNTLTLLSVSEKMDLTQAIVDYSFKVAQRAHLSNGFSTTGDPVSLPIDVRRQIFGIVREALNNVEKFAHAERIQVSLVWDVDSLTVLIEDNGVGFDPASVREDGHYGLMMMRELSNGLLGKFEIQSVPGSGTKLKFLFPLPYLPDVPVDARTWSAEPHSVSDSSSPIS